MDDATILVTGGAGFIGSNLANHLAETNDVIALDDCSLGTPANLSDAIEFQPRSVLEDDLPTAVDYVFHLAALSSYQMHEETPAHGARVNVEGFVNVVEQARKSGCETIVYASTSSIYGTRTQPTTESTEITTNTGYEASKLAREKYAEYFSNHYDMTTTGLRFFSVYQGYGGAEEHKGKYANVIAQFADDIAHDRHPKLYGDGTQSRDFTHIDDVIQAIVTVADHDLSGIYNIGTGNRFSFNTVVDMINEQFGKSITPKYVDNPISSDVYVKHTCADSSKLRNATGWQPEISFDEGIRRVCHHYLA